MRVAIFEKSYLVQVQFSLSSLELLLEYSLSRQFSQQSLRLAIPIPFQLNQSIQGLPFQHQVKQVILHFLQAALSPSSFTALQSALLSAVNIREIEKIRQVQRKQLILLQQTILQRCCDYKSK